MMVTMNNKPNPFFIINSVAPIRISDNGGWTDTWFAEHGLIFNIGVYPYAEVQIAVYDAAEATDRIVINAENYGERYALDPDQHSSQNGWNRHPLLVFPHGGVHGDFNTYYTHIVRELMEQGYVVIAPEYRGSTGYGRGYYEAIDYGGIEIEDVVAARDWAVEGLDFVDGGRVGIIGWSHGGLIALMSVFDHPDKFQVAYAGVPVSDLVARMGYQTQDYRDLYSVEYHIGETAFENTDEYKRRSPAWNAHKLETPLLIHTNTSDRDVNVLEVEHLIKSLQAADKDFEYKIYEDAPGGHSFNRLDSSIAHESRQEIYAFLRRYLK